jgi:tetratricopeptide (TPR) repeat protein
MTASQTSASPRLAELMQTGMAALRSGDIDGAIRHFADARRLAPADNGLLRTLAALYQHAGRWGELWPVAETGLALWPGDPGFATARIVALGGADCTDAALTLARGCLRETPGDIALLQQYGSLLLKTGDAAGALDAVGAALTRQPDTPALLSIAAEAAFRLGDHAVARAWLDRAITLEPQNRALRMARATMLLSLGEWAPGLRDYEFRLQPDATREILRQGLTLPRWQGEDLQGKALLVVSEQGVGDQMRFLRDVIALRPLCGGMIVECAARLVPLFRRSLPADTLVMAAREQPGERRHVFDYGWLADARPQPDAYIEMGSAMLRLLERGLPFAGQPAA